MKNRSFALAAILLSHNVYAVETNFCDSTKGLEQITEYINCSGSPKLAACGALGGLIAGRGVAKVLAAKREIAELEAANKARPLTPVEQFKYNVYRGDFENRSGGSKLKTYAEFEQALNSEIYRTGVGSKEFVLKNLVPPVDPENYVPRGYPHLERLDGKVYDIFQMSFDEVPRNSKFFQVLQTQNKLKIDMILDAAASGKNINSFEWKFNAAEKLRLDFIQEYLEDREPWKYRAVHGLLGSDPKFQMAKIENAVRLYNAENGIGKSAGKIAKSLLSSTARMGSKAWMLSGGIFGAGLALGTEVVLPQNTACTTLSESYMNVDENCKPVYEVDAKVLRFLDKDKSEQAKILKSDANVCAYYKQLHGKAFEQVQFKSLECKASGFVATAKVPGFQDIRYIADQNSSGNVSKLSVHQNKESKNNATYSIAASGEISSYDRGGDKISTENRDTWPTHISAQLNKLKLFIPEMQECCKSRDPSCKKDFGLVELSPSTADSPKGVAATR